MTWPRAAQLVCRRSLVLSRGISPVHSQQCFQNAAAIHTRMANADLQPPKSSFQSHSLTRFTANATTAHGFHFSAPKAKKFRTVKTPRFPDSVSEGNVWWHKAVGDQTAISLPSPISGVIEELLFKDGEKVTAGGELYIIRIGAGRKSSSRSNSPSKLPKEPPSCLPGSNLPVASASGWTEEYTDYFGVTLMPKSVQEFLGKPVEELRTSDQLKEDYPMLQHLFQFTSAQEVWHREPQNVEAGACLSFIDDAVPGAFEAATTVLVLEVFQWLKYKHDEFRTLLEQRQTLKMCNEDKLAMPDMVIVAKGKTVLVLAEVKPRKRSDSDDSVFLPKLLNVYPQLIAEIIAMVQDRQSALLAGQKLQPQVIPGMIVRGSAFDFFKITVTADLIDRVEKGIRYTESSRKEKVVLEHCSYIKDGVGLESFKNRELIFGVLEEFKKIVFGWDGVLTPFNRLFGQMKPPIRILLQGLSGSGKTTILNHLPASIVISEEPGVGLEVELVSYGNDLIFESWDLGAEASESVDMGSYYAKADAMLYCVDSCNRQAMEKSKKELATMLERKELQPAIVMVLANKKDFPPATLPGTGAMSLADIRKALGLDGLENGTIDVCEVSISTGKGFDVVMQRVSKAIEMARTKAAPSPVSPTKRAESTSTNP